MEQKNSYVIVGIFVVVFFILMIGGILWMQKHSQDTAYNYYQINTKDSASGLGEKAAVKFNGLTVGEVSKLYINKDNLEEVSIVIKVTSQTPIKVDTTATIESLGITGLSYIQLAGGSVNASELQTSDEEYGIIKSAPSIMTRVDNRLTSLLSKTDTTLNQINKIASDDNIQNLEEILKNVSNITASFANTMAYLDGKIEKVDSIMDSALGIEKSMQTALNSASSVVKSIEEKMKKGEFDLNAALNKNLSPVQNVFNELSILLQQFRQSLDSIKNSPSDLFFKSSGVEPGPGE